MISRNSGDIPKQLSRRFFLGGTAAAPASAASTGRAAITGPVRIDAGLVQGVSALLAGVTVFKGIPFAATTAGENCWRPPRPRVKWDGVLQADTFGDICPQTALGGPAIDVPMSEDCLNLNVWTAAAGPGERRPVFVWIYGGRFVGGYGSSAQFDGSGLARKGLVVVTLNYRTASYGFLATPELSEESGHHASGNYGLLDQAPAGCC